jgi:anti-sigma B factor antagonist
MDGVGAGNDAQMTFDVASVDGIAVVSVNGELDMANIEPLELAVAPIVAQRPKKLVVDVGGLRFADSSAIALWVRWAASVGEVELRDASPLLRRVITSMGLGERLRLSE